MSDQVNPERNFKERLKETYRVTVQDVSDLSEVGRYQFSMLKLYTWISIAVLSAVAIVVCLIAFTPLKRLMPGYGDIEENSKYVELRKKILDLEEDLQTQEVYTEGLQNMLAGKGLEELPLQKKKSTPIEEKETIVSKENIEESKVTQKLNSLYFVPPINGKVSAPFSRAIDHLGTDIVASKDTPIKSISSGVVISSDFSIDTGNSIVIQHEENVISVYKHNSALLKKSGDLVRAGEAIAIIGNSGELTDGPHLHFELWYNGSPVNPENFIDF